MWHTSKKENVVDSYNQYLGNIAAMTFFILNHSFLEKNYSSRWILVIKSSNKALIVSDITFEQKEVYYDTFCIVTFLSLTTLFFSISIEANEQRPLITPLY